MQDYTRDNGLNQIAQEAIEAFGDLPLDRTFGGVAISADGVRVNIVGAMSPELNARKKLLALRVPVDVQQVGNSELALTAVSEKIAAEAESWRSKGIQLSGWGIDPTANKVALTLSSFSEAAAKQLVASYGPAEVYVMQESVSLSAVTRKSDTSVFRGGDQLEDASGHTCTSWFGTKSATSSTLYTFTAGHCLTESWHVYQGGSWGVPHTVRWGGSGGASVDGEDFQLAGDATVWADPSTTYRTVNSVSTSEPQNGLICLDGAFTRELCNVKIVIPSYTATYNGKTITDTTYVRQINGLDAFISGDSGGPVYTSLVNNRLNARGMIAAEDLNHPDSGVYVKASNIQTAFNVKVLLG